MIRLVPSRLTKAFKLFWTMTLPAALFTPHARLLRRLVDERSGVEGKAVGSEEKGKEILI